MPEVKIPETASYTLWVWTTPFCGKKTLSLGHEPYSSTMRASRLPLVAVAVSVWPLFVHALPQFFNGVILAVPPVTPPGQCATTGAHILTVRGLNEPLTNGPIQPLVNATVAALPGSDVTPVPYSASNGYPFYSASVDEGAANTVAYITQYAKDCPRSSIVVLGYSEGAQAVMSAVCGESSFGFTASTPLSTALLPNRRFGSFLVT